MWVFSHYNPFTIMHAPLYIQACYASSLLIGSLVGNWLVTAWVFGVARHFYYNFTHKHAPLATHRVVQPTSEILPAYAIKFLDRLRTKLEEAQRDRKLRRIADEAEVGIFALERFIDERESLSSSQVARLTKWFSARKSESIASSTVLTHVQEAPRKTLTHFATSNAFIRIALIGYPGVRKGVFGALLAQSLRLPYADTGNILRRIYGHTSVALSEKYETIARELTKPEYKKGYIVDSARLTREFRVMQEKNIITPDTLFVYLQLSPEESIALAANRYNTAKRFGRPPRYQDYAEVHAKRMNYFWEFTRSFIMRLKDTYDVLTIDLGIGKKQASTGSESNRIENLYLHRFLPEVKKLLSKHADENAVPPEWRHDASRTPRTIQQAA
jgi:hypothetical protein